MKIFLDIETGPTKDKVIIDQIRDSIMPPGNITKTETKLKWLEENLEEATNKALRNTSLDGLYGHIISIAWAIDDNDVNCIYLGMEGITTEKDLLVKFFYELSKIKDKHGQRSSITQWVGHYLSFFDLRFIWQRCVINQVKPTITIPYDARPWDDRVFDTKIAWTGASQYSGAGSLDKLSSVLLGQGKGEINGANVYDYFLRGEIDKIVEYNKEDVEMCRKLYKRMNFI